MTHPCLARIWKGLVSLLGMMLLVPLLMPGMAFAVKSDQAYFDLEYLGIRTMALYRMVLDPDDSDFVEGEAFSQFSPGPGSSIARSEEGVVFRYQLIKERACRGRNEGGVHGRRTFAACAKLCIDDEDCISFEFGQVGGRKVRRCTISHSCTYEQSVPSGNYDLWILQRGIPGGDAGSVADEVPDTSASTGSDSESRAADSGGTGTGWLTGGPEGECRHDEDGVWAPGMNWEECIGVKWNAANGYDDVDSNPICWSLGGTTAEFFNIEPQYEDMWVVGRAEGTRWAPGKRSEYLCRTACAMIGGPRGCRDTSVGWAMPRTEWESIRTYCEINRMTTPGRSEGEVVVILRSRLREKCCHQMPNLNGCE